MPKPQPMSAGRIEDPADLPWPLFASPKIDGARAWLKSGMMLSRRLEVFPNRQIQEMCAATSLRECGFDGELVIGPPHAPDACRRTMAYLSAIEAVEPLKNIGFWVFDIFNKPELPFHQRRTLLSARLNTYSAPHYAWIKNVGQKILNDPEDLERYEATQLLLGFEGVMLRHPMGLYKHGRSTLREAYLLKWTRWASSEAIIIGIEEAMANNNLQKENKIGVLKRSSHKAGKVGKGTAGSLEVRDLKTNVEFNIGAGLTDEDREFFWKNRVELVRHRTVVKYRFKPAGVKDRPRHPVYDGLRPKFDMPA